MLDLLLTLLFCWLFFRAMGLTFRIAWGGAKIAASILFAIALPMLVGFLMIAGGILLVIPVILVAIAFAIVKACV